MLHTIRTESDACICTSLQHPYAVIGVQEHVAESQYSCCMHVSSTMLPAGRTAAVGQPIPKTQLVSCYTWQY
jgi:hypothetical protein